jgi:hypothetical protein
MNGARALTVLIGSIALAAGALIALLSGGCTIVFGWFIVSDALNRRGGLDDAVQGSLMVLGIGGFSFAVGAVAAWAGWRMLRGPKAPRINPKAFE